MSSPSDLLAAARAYADAVGRGDTLWSLQLLGRVQEIALDEHAARLDHADAEGYGWDDIGEVFGMDGYRAAIEFHTLGHGPDFPV